MQINIFFSIELAFNVLLIFEAMSLIFLFPNSVADSVGKQFEIISLILLRDAFKEFGHYLDDLEWNKDFLVEMIPIISDAFGAILVFLITGLFFTGLNGIFGSPETMKSNQASSKSRNSYPFTWCFSSWLLVFTTCLWPMKAKPSTPVSSFFLQPLDFHRCIHFAVFPALHHQIF